MKDDEKTHDGTLSEDDGFERDLEYVPGKGAIVVWRARRSNFCR